MKPGNLDNLFHFEILSLRWTPDHEKMINQLILYLKNVMKLEDIPLSDLLNKRDKDGI